jgi:hypothetical protein
MNRTPQVLLVLSFIVNSIFSFAQNGGAVNVKAVKISYDWNEKITIQFSGLPEREQTAVVMMMLL